MATCTLHMVLLSLNMLYVAFTDVGSHFIRMCLGGLLHAECYTYLEGMHLCYCRWNVFA